MSELQPLAQYLLTAELIYQGPRFAYYDKTHDAHIMVYQAFMRLQQLHFEEEQRTYIPDTSYEGRQILS